MAARANGPGARGQPLGAIGRRAGLKDPPDPHDPQHHAEAHVQDDVGEVEQRRAGGGRQIGAVNQEGDERRAPMRNH